MGGTGGGPTTGSTGAGAFGGTSNVPPISCDIATLLATCNGSICHSSSQREGDLILDQADPLGPEMARELIGTYASYSGVQDAWNCPQPGSEVRVDPTNIEASQILTKLIGPPSCGEPMPNTEPQETAAAWLPENRAASVQCIREWLLNLVASNP
jgi:hypothetical protein